MSCGLGTILLTLALDNLKIGIHSLLKIRVSTNMVRALRPVTESALKSILIVGTKRRTELLFDCLRSQEKAIEVDFGSVLSWERLDERRACRIAAYHEGNIDADSELLAEIREWAIGCLLRFKSVFPRRIEQCLDKIDASSINSVTG
jgi:uncharacterized protein DUF4268